MTPCNDLSFFFCCRYLSAKCCINHLALISHNSIEPRSQMITAFKLLLTCAVFELVIQKTKNPDPIKFKNENDY